MSSEPPLWLLIMYHSRVLLNAAVVIIVPGGCYYMVGGLLLVWYMRSPSCSKLPPVGFRLLRVALRAGRGGGGELSGSGVQCGIAVSNSMDTPELIRSRTLPVRLIDNVAHITLSVASLVRASVWNCGTCRYLLLLPGPGLESIW